MKNKQGITIAALIIAIVGLSIGFAAFANTLTISSSASVNPDPTSMNVVFSSSSSSAQYNSITPTKNLDNVTNFTATDATITGADYRTLNNVSAAFTAPGQSVTYNLYVYNAGSYKAYLNELNMGTKTCSIVENQEHPEQEATESLKNAACEGISITVKIDNVTLTSSGSLNNMELDVESSKPVQIVISYASGSAYVDGPISVTFGNITFNATSAPISSGSQGGNEQSGGQEEPQQTVDSLIPTETELNGIDPEEGAYSFISSEEVLSYNENSGMKYVYIRYGADDRLLWLCDSDTASSFSQYLGSTVEPNKWYNTQEGMPSTLYTGPSPISLSDFASEEILSESYVTRVINSFSNNG